MPHFHCFTCGYAIFLATIGFTPQTSRELPFSPQSLNTILKLIKSNFKNLKSNTKTIHKYTSIFLQVMSPNSQTTTLHSTSGQTESLHLFISDPSYIQVTDPPSVHPGSVDSIDSSNPDSIEIFLIDSISPTSFILQARHWPRLFLGLSTSS